MAKVNPKVKETFIEATDSIWGDAPEGIKDNPGRDTFWLPGYSDLKTQKELELRDPKYGDLGDTGFRAQGKTTPMKVRFHWTRVRKVSGIAEDTKAAERAATGYRACKWDEYEDLTGEPLQDENGYTCAARPNPDGTIQNGEYLLMVCNADVAARNAALKRQRDNDLLEAIDSRLDEKASKANQRMGLSGRGATGFDKFSAEE